MANRRKRRAQRKRTIMQSRTSWWEDNSWFLIIGSGILLIVAVVAWKETRIPLGNLTYNPAFMEQSRPFEIAYGDKEAPVTIIEYASLTCGSCKHFYEEVAKQVDSSYIRNGQVRLLFRHYPLNAPALDGALLLSCLSPEKAKLVIDTLFINQNMWSQADNPARHLKSYFIAAGMDRTAIERCLNDTHKKDALTAEQEIAHEALGIKSTPTVYINGRLYTGQKHFKALSRVLDFLLIKSEG
tara:strand:+ start:131 stop:853 length:723 start_codon:yes stop_codon:yes gene_type:complete